jgi:precorrin-3B C17-methyltransferase
VGLGPGAPEHRTARAVAALAESSVVFGYVRYTEAAADLLADKEVVASGMRHETERCREALARAAKGATVALICSGDAGVYGLAGLALTLRGEMCPHVALEVVPGVTASLAAGAALGAPFAADYATISLSDLLTPWEVIERRLTAAAEADFAVALYNPKSHARTEPWKRAVAIFLRHRPPETPCGVVRMAGTGEEEARVLTLAELGMAEVDMRCLVAIGNSRTRVIDGRLVTRRGYAVEGGP